MPTKAELADVLEKRGVEVPADATKDDLETLMVETKPDAIEDLRTPGGVMRRKVNRGSTRRINRALGNVEEALDAFAAEIDRQVWVTDENGERVAPHPLVEEVRAFRAALSGKVAEFTTPH